MLDSPMVTEDPEVEAARIGQAFGAPKTYDDLETAITGSVRCPVRTTTTPT